MKLSIRFGAIFFAAQSAWILMEYALGWHTTDVDVTRSAQGLFFIPACLVMFWGLWAKRAQESKLSYLSSITMGASVGLVNGLFSIPFHLFYLEFLNPHYHQLMIESMVSTGTATLEEATAQFDTGPYLAGLVVFPIVAGMFTNAVLALFLKTSWR